MPETTETPIEALTFDDALAELQRTVAELEAGGQPLERSIALYERGVALHERCAALLADAGSRGDGEEHEDVGHRGQRSSPAVAGNSPLATLTRSAVPAAASAGSRTIALSAVRRTIA